MKYVEAHLEPEFYMKCIAIRSQTLFIVIGYTEVEFLIRTFARIFAFVRMEVSNKHGK